MSAPSQLLKEFNLRSTPSRKTILNIFLKKNYALAHSDIEKAMPSDFDRVTVYRTLKTFLDKGLIHKVLDDQSTLKYALCSEACTMAGHHHDHVHFKCTVCGHTSCLAVNIPSIKLPSGYRPVEQNLLIQGICAHCS